MSHLAKASGSSLIRAGTRHRGRGGLLCRQRSTVGAGVQVAAGRSIPGGVTIVAGSGSTVTRIPEGIEGLTKVADGSLERV